MDEVEFGSCGIGEEIWCRPQETAKRATYSSIDIMHRASADGEY